MTGGVPISGAADQLVVSAPPVSKAKRMYAFALVTSLFFAWGFAYGLLDVLNKHFQVVFGITKLQSTMMQVAYFGAYFVFGYPAGQYMSKVGYKRGIYLGLGLYSLGAIMYWPAAKSEKFYGFVLCTLVIGSGLCCLEVAANSYIAVLGDPKDAALRLNFAQSFNGVAAFTGPLIASHAFFKGSNQNSLHSVQFVYLGVACLGAGLIVLFYFADLPEISESELQQSMQDAGTDVKPLWRQWHTIFAFVAQFCYCGAQVTFASFVLNYITDDAYLKTVFDASAASRMVSYMQITFMVGRFASTPLLVRFRDDYMLLGWSGMTAIFALVAALTGGRVGLGALFVVFFFESIQYPTIFVLGTSNLGRWTKRGSSIVVMGVGGGAVFPPLEGLIADSVNTTRSYIVPFIGYTIVACYAVGMIISRRRSTARLAAGLADGIVNLPASSIDEKKSASSHSEFLQADI